MKKILLPLWFFAALSGTLLRAQPPADYYSSAEGLSGQSLQQALHQIIDDHKVVTYQELWNCFKTTDAKPDGTVWDIYSDIPGKTPLYVYHFTVDQCGNYSREGDCYNREHAFPKSWFGDAEPMYTDLFHIYPTDGWVNNKRGNLPYGETAVPRWISTNGSETGPSSVPGYNGEVFEPVDEYKGDLARTFFYMATRYYGESNSWQGSDMVIGAEPRPWALQMLMAWHRQDTVSRKEIDRNNEVYKFQNNRNPFIDDPLFAERIWGSMNPVMVREEEEPMVFIYPNPVVETVTLRMRGAGTSGARLTIFDVSGLTLVNTRTEGQETMIPVQKLRPGLYFLKITISGGSHTVSFIKVGW